MTKRWTTIATAIAMVVAGWVSTATPAGALGFTVSNEAELRDALADASAATTGSHVIFIDADFTISGVGDPTYTGTRPLRIEGDGHTIAGSAGHRVLLNAGGPALTINGLTVRGGDAARGGAIRSEGSGSVLIEGSRFEDNSADTIGGALDVFGPLTVRDTVFVRNHAQLGAAIRAASLDLQGSWLTGNVGRDSTVLVGDLTIDSSVVSLNEGRSVIESFADVADTHLVASNFERNAGEVLSRGGAPGQIDVVDSRFVANGGAIAANHQSVVVEGTLFDGNHGGQAGAIWASDATVDASAFVDNHGGSGGAISADEGLDVTNSTFARNAGGVAGAIHGSTADVRLDHVTLEDNTSNGNGRWAVLAHLLTTRGTYFGENVLGDACEVDGPTTSEGYNVAIDSSCGLTAPSDQVVTPGPGLLGALRDNGGGLPSYLPVAGSPLLDVEPRSVCTVATDQRGVTRSIGAGCDVGAIEQAYPSAAFADVPQGLAAPVSWVTSRVNHPVLLPARGGGLFQPNAVLTRGDAARALYRAAGAPGRDSAGQCTDMIDTNADEACWSEAMGFFVSDSAGLFHPDRRVTRVQWVNKLHHFSGYYYPPDLRPHGFVDVAAGNGHVQWAAHFGIATGFAGRHFRPNAPATRGQAASMLWRLALDQRAWSGPIDVWMPVSPYAPN